MTTFPTYRHWRDFSPAGTSYYLALVAIYWDASHAIDSSAI